MVTTETILLTGDASLEAIYQLVKDKFLFWAKDYNFNSCCMTLLNDRILVKYVHQW